MSNLRHGLASKAMLVAATLLFAAVAAGGVWWSLHLLHQGHGPWPVLALLTSLAVLAGTAVAWLVRESISGPLQRLADSLESAVRGKYQAPLDEGQPQEIGRLNRALNQLVPRLTDLEAAQIDSDLMREHAQHEARLKEELGEKNRIIEETNTSLSQRLAELELLFGLTNDLVGTLEPEEIFKIVIERVGRSMSSDGFLLLVLDENQRSLRVAGAEGVFLQMPPEDLVDAQQGPCSDALRKRRLVRYEDLAIAEEHKLCERLGRRGSLLGVPLIHKNRSFGVMNFYRREPASFSANEGRLLELLAHQTSLALAAARLYQEKLDLSVTDDLTQVANRRQLHYRMEMEWNRTSRFGGSLSVLMVDVDHFKGFNDRNGHLLGDRVLRDVAALLKGNTRNVDTVARFGGEEFVVILPGQGKPAAQSVAEKLRLAVAERSFPQGHSQPLGRVTISLGVATFPGDADNPAQLLERADLALYASKRMGRNRTTVYQAELSLMAEERKQHEARRRPRRRRRYDRMQFIDPT